MTPAHSILISTKHHMNVSQAYLDQAKIIQSGTDNDRLALASSPELLPSLQIALGATDNSQIILALTKRPDLTELTQTLLLNSGNEVEDATTLGEETMRAVACYQVFCKKYQEVLYNIALDGVMLDTWAVDRAVLKEYARCISGERLAKNLAIMPAVQRAIIDINCNYEMVKDERPTYSGFMANFIDEMTKAKYPTNYPYYLAEAFEQIGFGNIHEETQIYFAEKLVQFKRACPDFDFDESADFLLSSPEANFAAKVILKRALS